jgi:hypothetical protein
MRAAGVDVRVNIVGYAIDDSNLASTFEAWAAAGGGEYFDAADAKQLSAALQHATAPPFRILDHAGGVVAAGLAGDPPVTLPAGLYTVQICAKSSKGNKRQQDDSPALNYSPALNFRPATGRFAG